MDGKLLDTVKRYGAAVVLAGFALGLRSVLPFPEGAGIYQLPLAAVVLSAWYGGRGPGLLATLISVPGATYLLPPANSFDLHPEHALPLGIFAALCLLLAEFSAGRRRVEHARRDSEERFRTLVDFSFDVYWESDTQHRFTRQEFTDRLKNAPSRDSELGKTRWQIPYLEPDEDAWCQHRATLDAHLPFREFELARPTSDGGRRYVSVSGVPVFDELGRFAGYRGVGRDITERKLAEVERLTAFRGMRESERRLQAAQGIAHVGWWERDYATGRVSLSDETCRILGVLPLELPQWHGRWVSLIHPEDRERTAAASDAALAGGPRYDVEYRVVRPDGTTRVVHSQGDVSRDESGRVVRQFGVLQDITEQRQTERKLEAAQRLAHVGWWERDFAAGLWLTSDEIRRIYGIEHLDRVMDLAEWMKVVPSIIHPEDRKRVLAASEASLRGDPRYDIEYRIVHADGTVRVVHAQADMTLDESGRPVRQFGVAQDITDLRQAEQEVHARQEMLDLAQKAARAVAFDWHIGARESENRWSPDLEAMYGLQPGAFDRTFKGWKKLVHPDDWPLVVAALARAQEAGDVAAEYRVVYKDGNVHWLQAKGRMFFDAERKPERMVGFMIDVTERRRAEEELRASEARFRTFVDHATDGFFLMDQALTILDVNRQGCASLGYTREELIGMRPREYDPSLSSDAMAQLEKRVSDGETVTFETLNRRKDGTVFPIEIRLRKFEQGGKRYHISLARDITERKVVEETLRGKDAALQLARTELARVSRLTTLGELTASIAHEVNQPIGAMVTNAAAGARWLSAKPPNMAEARTALAHIVSDGKRAGEVIARIRALTRRQMPRMESLDVNRRVMEVVALAEHELKAQEIVVRMELDPKLPRVAGDLVQLQQVLLNLLLNAVEAMSGVHDRPRELTVATARSDPNAVVVEVRDSGPGIDQERVERVFEPFYTTKTQGIGIGLSISRSIIEAHGGRLWAAANRPHGAVLRLSLPIAKAAAA